MLIALDEHTTDAIPRYAISLAELECHRAKRRMREYAQKLRDFDGKSEQHERQLVGGAREALNAYQQAKLELKRAESAFYRAQE